MDTPDPKGDTPSIPDPTRATLSPEDVRSLSTAAEMLHRGIRAAADLDGAAERFRGTIAEINDALKPLAAFGDIRGPIAGSTVTEEDGLMLRIPGGYEIAFADLNTADCTRVLRAMPEWLREFTADAIATFDALATLQSLADGILRVMRGGAAEAPREGAGAPEASPTASRTPPVGATEHAPRGVRFGEVHYTADGSGWLPVQVVPVPGAGRGGPERMVLAMARPGLAPRSAGEFVTCPTRIVPLDLWHRLFGVVGDRVRQ